MPYDLKNFELSDKARLVLSVTDAEAWDLLGDTAGEVKADEALCVSVDGMQFTADEPRTG